jgi:L-fuculose-phosphate aldolase
MEKFSKNFELSVNIKKKELIDICKQIVEKNLVAGTWGNVSCKIDENFIIITPSAISYDKLDEESISIVDRKTFEFIGKKPSTELNLHLAIYQNRNDINAVIHTHSLYASIFAATHKNLKPMLEEIAQICGPAVKCTKYAIAGSELLVKNTIPLLQDANAAFLANHGAIACGRTLKEALTCAIILEKGCKIYCKSKNVGKLRFLPYLEAKKLYLFYREKYQAKPE